MRRLKDMRFRLTKKEDMPKIEAINTLGFKLNPGELSIVDGVIVDDNDEIIAFGITKPMAEATFLSNPDKSQRARVGAMRMLFEVAFEHTREFGIKQIHVFCDDKRLANALIKHYDFMLCDNIVLVKNL